MDSQWLTVEYIARDLQVSETTVRGWIRDKKLRGAKFGRDYRILRDDYEDFIKRHLDKDNLDDND
ncbi:MAG: helix-turn-helix domain-containing protein [Ktedonobacteraceae bacterium]